MPRQTRCSGSCRAHSRRPIERAVDYGFAAGFVAAGFFVARTTAAGEPEEATLGAFGGDAALGAADVTGGDPEPIGGVAALEAEGAGGAALAEGTCAACASVLSCTERAYTVS